MSDRGQRFATWGLRWLLLMALWLALTDTRAAPELVAGAAAAALGAILSGLVLRPGDPSTLAKSLALVRLGPRRLGHPLARLVPETAVLIAALWRRVVLRRPVSGSLRAAPLQLDESRRSAAGRTLTELWGSLLPNRYVVGIDEAERIVLVHELIRSDRPIDPLGQR